MMRRRKTFSRVAVFVSVALCSSATLAGTSTLRGYDDSFADAIFAVLQEIDPASGAVSVPAEYLSCPTPPPVNTVFGVSFTSGLAYLGSTLYGLEWDGGSGPDVHLYTMAPSFCATGTRVDTDPVGFTNLESLAYNRDDGYFYSADFDFSGHEGNLIRIDPVTGAGTQIGGPMITDLRVVGLAWNPLNGVLYGITSAFASRGVELITIDTETGVASVIGPTGTAANSMESLTFDFSTSPPRLLAAGSTLYELDPTTGAATLIGDAFNGKMWAMASLDTVVFADGFESGELSRWSDSTP